MGNIAIRVEGLSKQFKIGEGRRHDTLRDHVAAGLRKLLRIEDEPSSTHEKTIWALQDVSFEIEQGDIVGLIGRNGAGKSTLLKILSRIVEPTSGRGEIYGRVGSLLDVGTGFHPELTGRENISLNASILGFRRKEIRRRFDEIVAFSGVEKFIDTPVKYYSSGMYVRLAFAVAAHLDPEVLIIDEVLAVGDAAFQQKCLGKIDEVAKSGRTVVFVTHAMGVIASLCKTGLWLDQGRLVGRGDIEHQVQAYMSVGTTDRASAPITTTPESLDFALCDISLCTADGSPASALDFRLPFRFDITYQVNSPLADVHISVSLSNDFGVAAVFTSDTTYLPGRSVETTAPGLYRTSVAFPGHFLVPGHYYVDLGAELPNVRVLHQAFRCLSFTIRETGGIDGPAEGVVYPELPWRTERVTDGPGPGREVVTAAAAAATVAD
jgi:lipopolysaccharide transport system ATP-binding protein